MPRNAFIITSEEDELDKKIKTELSPFLNGIRNADPNSSSRRLFKRAYLDFNEWHKQTKEVRTYAMTGLMAQTDDVKDSLQWMFSYLGLVETLGTGLADILIMLLVANGIDFHLERSSKFPRIKHAITMKDLKDDWIPLASKLTFLRENGITTVPTTIDTKTRNRIAHMNFNINGKKIIMKGKPVNQALLRK